MQALDQPSIRATERVKLAEEVTPTIRRLPVLVRSQRKPPKNSLCSKSGLALVAPEEFPAWDALVEESEQCSVFNKSWWLQATCGEARVLGYYEPGRMVAGIPLYYQRRFGLKLCRMPGLTQTWGVVMPPLPGKFAAQSTRETEILDAFARYLSRESVFIQAFHPSMQNWLPFYWQGFTQTTHYTYVFDDLTSLSTLWQGLEKDRRNNIRKARRLGVTVKECGPEAVYLAAKSSFDRQNRKCPYSLEYLCRLYEAARAHNAGICMAASDSRGKVHAAEFFVWDAKRGYRLAGGHDTSLGPSGGAVLLVWTLMEFAATRTAVFDFEGSMHKPIEASFRSFGARRVGYQRIVKLPPWMRMALCATGRHQI